MYPARLYFNFDEVEEQWRTRLTRRADNTRIYYLLKHVAIVQFAYRYCGSNYIH